MKKRLLIIVSITTILAFVWAFNFPFRSPDVHLIDGFVYLRQPDGITCGPTSATMVLQRYGKQIVLDQVKFKATTQWFMYRGNPVGMTSPDLLSSAMGKLGVATKTLRGNFAKLKYFVSKNRPAIVLLRSGSLTWHYVVVVGYDQFQIFVADPSSGGLIAMSNEQFWGSWSFKTDMEGDVAGHEPLVFLMQAAEIYPNTMIVPWNQCLN